jgi:hypothetical protein
MIVMVNLPRGITINQKQVTEKRNPKIKTLADLAVSWSVLLGGSEMGLGLAVQPYIPTPSFTS